MIEHDDHDEHDEHDDPLDFPAPIAELASHYPGRDDAKWDAMVAGVMRSAAPELARRRARRGIVPSLLQWARPVGIAAAVIFLFGGAGLAMTSDAEANTPVSALTFAEVVDREPATRLLATEGPPSASDLARVLEGDVTQQVQP
jgi:hypothetical protein